MEPQTKVQTQNTQAALNDSSRLRALVETGLLEPETSDALDAIAVLAADVLGVQVALTTLVTPDRQSFVGACGLSPAELAERGTGIEYSFCQYVVAGERPLVVEDARLDPVLSTNLGLTENGWRAYAGFPIRSPQGLVLGSMCALSQEPRRWSTEDLRRLERFALLATREVAAAVIARDLAMTVTETAEMVDSALEAIVTTDAGGRITGWNQQATRIFGWHIREVIGRSIIDVLTVPENRDHLARAFAAVVDGETDRLRQRREHIAVRKDGSRLPAELTVTVTDGNRGPRVHCFISDLTERKRQEDARERLLAQEQAQAEELRRLDRLKDDFVALVSHELKNPLANIQGYAELLTDQADDMSPTQRRMVEAITRGADRSLTIVSDLLDIAKLEGGNITIEPRPMDLRLVVGDAVEAALPACEAKNLTLAFGVTEQAVVMGDATRLRQVVDNLFSNAVKYTPEGGRIDVTMEIKERTVELLVADTGIGIPEDEQGRLFERFFRASSAREHQIPGTGLGLAITRMIVQQHGGKILARSTPGSGTTFRVSLLRA